MAQSTGNPPPPGVAESQAYVFIQFYIERPNGAFEIHEADCLLASEIIGHKEDLENVLGDSRTQRWLYDGQLLDDNQRLLDYKINGTESIKIVVNHFEK